MKVLLFLCCLYIAPLAKAQTQKVLINNDKVIVTEFVSGPGEGACGKGLHHHPPHLTVLLTDADVRVSDHGKTSIQKAPAGTVFWSGAIEHEVINMGTTPIKTYIIVPKNSKSGL